MPSPRKVLVVTGSRAEYDIMYKLLQLLEAHPGFDLSLLVTGPHLAEKYGYTARHITEDGFRVADSVFNLVDSGQKIGRVISLGNQISHFAQTFFRERPDLVIAIGDREEAISTTLTAAYMDIPVAHIFGGDIAKDGNIDNAVRYAASKFAHIHFTAHPQHSETLLRLGEDPWRIHYVGNPAIDRLVDTPLLSPTELAQRVGFMPIGTGPFMLMAYHPIITEYENEGENVRQVLKAVVQCGLPCVVNSPNSDAGNHAILEVYAEYANHPNLFFFKNLGRVEYVNLLRQARVMLGNSSAGVVEVPTLGLPVVNIGPRQRGRLHGQNIQFVDYDTQQVLDALIRACTDETYRAQVKAAPNPYGNGDASQKIVDVLAALPLDGSLTHKNITYEWKPF